MLLMTFRNYFKMPTAYFYELTFSEIKELLIYFCVYNFILENSLEVAAVIRVIFREMEARVKLVLGLRKEESE